MQVEEIKKYCLRKHNAYEDLPFGEVPICYKLNGKIFAQIYPYEYDCKTIDFTDFPDDELLNMIDLAYETVLNSFSKKIQKRIIEDETQASIK